MGSSAGATRPVCLCIYKHVAPLEQRGTLDLCREAEPVCSRMNPLVSFYSVRSYLFIKSESTKIETSKKANINGKH